MSPTHHSIIGASSLKRKMECKGSHLLEMSLPKTGRKSSIFAAEGTLCHAISEDCILTDKDPETLLDLTQTVDGFAITVNQEMVEGARLYVEHVRSLASFGFDILLEAKVAPYKPWNEPENMPVDLFGTCDCIALSPDGHSLEIVDLKYGRGVPVEADMNPQLLYYALGALSEMSPQAYNQVREIRITIVQPRAPHHKGAVRSFSLSRLEMEQWAFLVFRPAVEQMLMPDQPLAAGDHCRFCPCILVCPAMRQASQDAARHAFDDDDAPKVVPADDDLAEMATLAQLLEKWIAAIQLELHQRLVAGRTIPGFKLVDKRATRSWADEDAVLAAAKAFGVENIVTETKTTLLSPTQAESKLKKNKDVWPVLAAHITKQSSGTTFAPVSDPRPAVPGRISAEDAFAED